MAEQKLYGYVGKIARIDLTESTVEIIPTSNYVPEYIGGRQICHKIFWDEVGPGVGAFDPENKLIFMTGPTAGTGIPSGSRAFMAGIAASTYPEQYSFGSMGGWVAPEIKYAGFDGLILQGKAKEPSYILVTDGKIEILPAGEVWGKLVHPAQEWFKEKHGIDSRSMVIGPAGENLCRDATITTNGDNAFAKSGFGAVMGSKNLKGVVFRGKGAVVPADPERILRMRKEVGGGEHKQPNPVVHMETFNTVGTHVGEKIEGGVNYVYTTCSPGCTFRCNKMQMGLKSAFEDKRINQVEKCYSMKAADLSTDSNYPAVAYVHSEKNRSAARMLSGYAIDRTDPELPAILADGFPSNVTNYFSCDYERGMMTNNLCNEYGLDKWEITAWVLTWLAMCKKEGLLDELDFGMEPDVENPEFIKHFIRSWVYREGIGDLFAEGMARATRKLGKEKFFEHSHFGVKSGITGETLEVPVSLHGGWGHSVHWQGRGVQNAQKWFYMASNLLFMINTHNALGSAHSRVKPGDLVRLKDKELEVHAIAEDAVFNIYGSEIKDMVTACEWTSPDIYWADMEAEMYTAATGIPMDTAGLRKAAIKSQLLHRAIIMRNHGRIRDMEVEEIFPIMTYPDSWGVTLSWDEWNDYVDEFYKLLGWDLRTGWPLKECFTDAGLSDVAEELEKLGMIPDPTVPYERKKSPFVGHKKVE